MKVIGITGGVGSGKSALLSYIKGKYDCEIILADEAAHRVKLEGKENDLLEKLKADPAFHLDEEALTELLDVRQFIGCAPEQTLIFLEEQVRPVLASNTDIALDENSVQIQV